MKKLLCLLALLISISGCATTGGFSSKGKGDNSLTIEYPNSNTKGTLIVFGCGDSIPNCTGDLIHHIQGKPVETLNQARKLLSKAPRGITVKASRIYNNGQYEEVTLTSRELGRRGENLMLLTGKPVKFIYATKENKAVDILQGPYMVTIAGQEIDYFYKLHINIFNNSQEPIEFKFSSLTVVNSDDSPATPLTPVELGYWLANLGSSLKEITKGKQLCLSDMTIPAGTTAKRNLFLIKEGTVLPITVKFSLGGKEYLAKLGR